jgi:SAM-dependent methyltransferase
MTEANTGWAAFWEGEPAAAAGATLANLPPSLRDRLDAPWSALANGLPGKGRVLDLATGGGVVLELLRRQRADLLLTGVDAAPQLPKRRGMVLRGGVSTDRLPFPDARFDAITSRFGIEYGPLAAGAHEAARVLRPDGTIGMLLHHADSNVLRHNRARRDALCWAARDSGWVGKAINLARTRMAVALSIPPAFRAAPAEAAARFPDQSAAWEFLTGLAQVLEAIPPSDSEAAIRQLEARADDELTRLDELLAAACDAARLTELTDAFSDAGFQLAPVRTVDEPSGVPLAWWIEGCKAA